MIHNINPTTGKSVLTLTSEESFKIDCIISKETDRLLYQLSQDITLSATVAIILMIEKYQHLKQCVKKQSISFGGPNIANKTIDLLIELIKDFDS